MGLGKTLQSVTLVYTLLTQGFEVSRPVARKIIIVTPTSLVSNWANEIEKWLGKGKVNVVALSEVGKDNIASGIDSFVGRGSRMHVLIVSYDTFRRQVDRLNKPGLCDLLICDEAHRSDITHTHRRRCFSHSRLFFFSLLTLCFASASSSFCVL